MIETAHFGGTQPGAIIARLEALEVVYNGGVRLGTVPNRLSWLEAAV
jgi:hypothetical protein